MLHHVDMEGSVTYEKLSLDEERLDLIKNPLVAPILKNKDKLVESSAMIERLNRL
jgi:hypothetical protein